MTSVGKSAGRKHQKSVVFCTLVPLLCCFIYAFLCMSNLHSPVSSSEAYAAYLARSGDFFTNAHPPFYYFALKIWSGIFGYTDISMRFLSVFFGALAIIFLFHLLKRKLDIKLAALFILLFSVAPAFVYCGQKISVYTLFFLTIVLMTYALMVAFETRKVRFYILAVLLFIPWVPDIFNVLMRGTIGSANTTGNVQEIVYDIHALAEEGEPIVVSDEQLYYSALFYDSATTYQTDAAKFWYITDYQSEARTLSDYHLPTAVLDGYRVVSEVNSDDYIAFELEREN